MESSESLNFFECVDRAEEFYSVQNQNSFEEGDNDYFRFKRWEWYWKSRVMPDGSFPDLLQQKRAYDELQRVCSQNRDLNNPWTNINQTSADGGYNGMGRATSIAFHPTDPNIFYVGAPIGGIWKTTDGGSTYAALGDSLPYVSAGNICINPQNPNTLYITVGDNTGWWKYGLGVFKSTDGGATWNPTQNMSSFTDGVAYFRMIINPQNGNELFSAQSNGLFRTQNGGDSWEVIHDGSHSDIMFKPDNDSTLYCATDDYWGNSEVYYTDDHGNSWSQISDFNVSANSIHLTVSPANSEYLGIESSVGGATDFYASYNSGLTVNYISAMPEDGIIYTSPISEDVIYCGYMVVYASYDGGLSWEQITDWWNSGEYVEVHADNHFVAHHPTTNEIYFCNDGGVYRLNENQGNWHELTSGLIITQFYRIAVSQQNPVFIIGGTQDNGGRKRIAPGVWEATNGGDAMEVAINTEDDAIIYTTYVNGMLYRSYDQWDMDTGYEITPPDASTGAWVTPYVLDPSNPSVIVAGYEDVYRSTNDGTTWSTLSTNLTGNSGNKIDAIAVAASNPQVIYAARMNVFYATTNGGNNWQAHIAYLGGENANIESIAVHPTDAQKVWITLSGYVDGFKVFFSEDGGQSFSNVSFNLPNVPCSASVIDRESQFNDLYVGTDIGIFILDEASSTWNYYGAGLPNTSVTDLEIQYPNRKLRAATFGRGVWENDLYSQPYVNVLEQTSSSGSSFGLNHNPVGEMLVIDVHTKDNWHGDVVIVSTTGKEILLQSRNFPVGNYQALMDVSSLTTGAYILQFQNADGRSEGIKFIKE